MHSYDGISKLDATVLLSVSEMGEVERCAVIEGYLDDKTHAARLISALIGVTDSIAENSRECVEVFAISGANLLHPNSAEKLNLPSFQGAMTGVVLSTLIGDSSVCKSCAFAKGAPANQCPTTTVDATDCVAGEDEFYCHQGIQDGDAPKKLCRGYLAALSNSNNNLNMES